MVCLSAPRPESSTSGQSRARSQSRATPLPGRVAASTASMAIALRGTANCRPVVVSCSDSSPNAVRRKGMVDDYLARDGEWSSVAAETPRRTDRQPDWTFAMDGWTQKSPPHSKRVGGLHRSPDVGWAWVELNYRPH